jgi:hypothetical protein
MKLHTTASIAEPITFPKFNVATPNTNGQTQFFSRELT